VFIQENIKGNAEAQVVLVEYSDFQCPACQAFAPVVEATLAEYGEDIRFEYKHFPLPIHPFALQAAVAAEAAGMQGKFFEYHDALFAEQKNWSAATTPMELFVSYADDLDLNITQFRRQMNSSILQEKIQSQMSEGQVLGISETLTFFLNGIKMEIQTLQDFSAQIAAAVDPESATIKTQKLTKQ